MSKQSEDGTEKVTAEETLKPISGNKLKQILKVRRDARDDRKGINENVAAKISEIVGDRYLDKTVLPVVEKLANMKDERLAYHLDNLLFYLDASGVSDRAKKVGRLPLEENNGEEGGNVRHLRRAAAAPAE